MSRAREHTQAVDQARESGDEKRLYEALEKLAKLVVWLRLRSDDPELVLRCVEEVMLSKWGGESRYSTWAWAIMVNQCGKHLVERIEARKRYAPIEEAERIPVGPPDDAKTALAKIRKRLSPEEASLLDLKLRGLSFGEIAQTTGFAERTILRKWDLIIKKLQRRQN